MPGYACPVCDGEHADAVHLAHHFGVTASLGRADHREWLEEHAPDWPDRGPEELAAVVREHADPIDVPAFERDSGAPDRPSVAVGDRERGVPGRDDGPAGAETERVLAEARELTREMYDDRGDGEREADDADEATDGDGTADADGGNEATDGDGASESDREENA